MVLGLSVRVSCICLLFFSSGTCFPTKGDYRYPYTWSSGGSGGSAPGSNLQSGSTSPPLVSLNHEPSANPQPEVASSPISEPNRFIVTFDSSANKPSIAPEVPSQSAGYVRPPVGPPPAGTGKKTPSFSVQRQPVASSSGNLNMGSVYEAYLFPPNRFAYPAKTAGNMATTDDHDDGPDPYAKAPATDYYGDGQDPYAKAPATDYYGDAQDPYAKAPATDYYGDGQVPWDEEPVGGDYTSYDPSNWMPSQPLPDLSAGDSDEMSETAPLPPSSYIIQSRNGYKRAREVISHTKYSPEYPEQPVFPSSYRQSTKEVTGSKGGTKV